MTVSHSFTSCLRPQSAFFSRALSREKGYVTIATTIAPSSFAMRATTGAAPVPVPPPIPAHRNTSWLSPSVCLSISLLASAHFCPTSGKPPAPSPFVMEAPSSTLLFACKFLKCSWSVLIATVVTPFTPILVILSTVLHPPPPTPTIEICMSSFPIISFSGTVFAAAPFIISSNMLPTPAFVSYFLALFVISCSETFYSLSFFGRLHPFFIRFLSRPHKKNKKEKNKKLPDYFNVAVRGRLR